MMKRIKSAVLPSSKKALVIGLMVAALLVAAAGFVAAQSSPDNTIYGCHDNKTGLLRIVARTTLCTAKEAPLSWNEVGPKGDTGATGAQGEKGDQGAQGL